MITPFSSLVGADATSLDILSLEHQGWLFYKEKKCIAITQLLDWDPIIIDTI